MRQTTHATTEVLRYTVFWLKFFLNDGAAQPKIVGNRPVFFLHDFIVPYLGQHRSFHPVSVLFFSESVFGRGLKLPNRGVVLEKKW